MSVSTGPSPKIRHSDFELLDTIGAGTFGRVRLVRHRPTQQFYAMKILHKAELIRLHQVEHVASEKSVLESLDHPFIVRLHYSYQDRKCLYMIMDFVVGGELFTQIRKAIKFPNDVAKFYAAEVILCIEYLHSMDIVYRDLKPENVLLDGEGHVRLIDFGFAKKVRDRTWTLCGTPDYLAPEIIQSRGHGKPADWWAVGVLIYEMLVGCPPFFREGGDSPMQLYQRILREPILCPRFLRSSARDLIGRLLTKHPSTRLGSLRGGAQDIKKHRWFRGVSWEDLYCRKFRAPIPIRHESPGDARNFATAEYAMMEQENPQGSEEIPEEDQSQFSAFDWGDFERVGEQPKRRTSKRRRERRNRK